MRTTTRRAALLALAALAACSEAPDGRPCEVDGNCSAGAVCREGLCVTLAVEAPSFTLDRTSPTRETSVTLQGTATGAARVVVLDGAVEVEDVAVVAGAWTAALTLEEGTHPLSARAEGPGGQRSAPSATATLVVDLTKPAPPSVLAPAVTNDQPVTVTGTREAGARVDVAVGGAAAGSDTGAGASWSVELTLDEGPRSLSVTATDAAGNVSDPATAELIVDRTATAAPALVLGTTSPTRVDPVPVSGTAALDAVAVVVRDGATPLATFDAAGGAWAGALTLGEGEHALTAVALDAAGNVSGASAAAALTVDRTAPAAPTVTGPALTNAQPVPLSGAAEAGATVEVREGAALLGSAVATGAGWSRNVTLAEGPHTVTVTATDPAGNGSAAAELSLEVDRTRPTVVSRSPAPGSAQHDFRQAITVTFSEPVTPGVQQGALTTSGGLSIVAAPGNVDADTIALTPSTRVTPDTFTVTVPADLRDAAGNLVQLPAGTWSFTAPAWLPVGPSLPLNGNAGSHADAVYTFERSELGQPQPGIADGRRRGGLARAGNELWAAFVEEGAAGPGTSALVVKRWNGTSWSALPSFPSSAAGEAVLGVQGGNPVVAYTEAGGLFVKRWTGTAWAAYEAAPGPLNDAAAVGISMVIPPGGDPVLAWTEPGNTTAGAVFVRRWGAAGWTAPELVTAGATDPTFTGNGYAAGACSVAADGFGVAVAVVRPDDVSFTDVVHVYRKSGASWGLVGGTPLFAFAPTNPGTQPHLLLQSGEPIVAWVVNNGCTTCRAVAVVAEFDGASWPDTLLPLNRADDQYAAAPQLALGPGGPVAVWHEGPSTPYRSYASLRTAGTWGALGGPDEGLLLASSRAIAPFLVLDADGVPIVLHAEVGAGGTRQIFVRRYNAASLP